LFWIFNSGPLQLAGQSATVPKIFMQPSRQQRQRVAVPELRCRAKPFVKRAADNPVMVYQRERFIRYDLFELIFGRAGARDVRRPRLWRDVVDPVPAQRVIVDLEFSSGSLDRCPGREEPLDPHAFEMIATLTSASSRTF
jgi:hypothetical protein